MRRLLRSVVGLSTGRGILLAEDERAREDEEVRTRERRGEEGGTKGQGMYGFAGPVDVLRGFTGPTEERRLGMSLDWRGGEEGRKEGSSEAEKVMDEVRFLSLGFGGKGGGTSGSLGCFTSFNLRLEEDENGLREFVV
jgi:hypothetical protein